MITDIIANLLTCMHVITGDFLVIINIRMQQNLFVYKICKAKINVVYATASINKLVFS